MNESDKKAAIAALNQIMEIELAGVVRYTHYSLMVFGYNRIPIVSWLKGNAEEGLTHAHKAGELATDGKGRIAEALAALGRAVFDTAPTVDDKLGAKYGDYARSASRSLQDASASLDTKSVEELGEDARQFVRKSPGLAVGIAAVGGFLLARLFRGSRD